MPEPVIVVEDIRKEFRTYKRLKGRFAAVRTLFTRQQEIKKAVDGISFTVDRGEIVGYVGPNGAGKSTTVKILSGILVPTSGAVTVSGIVPYEDRRRNAMHIGVVFGQRTQLWWDIPLRESYELLKAMYRVPDDVYKQNIEEFTEVLGIGDLMDTAVRQLSLGQRMRGDLAASLLHNPDILYLDEPTIGLDIVAKQKIREFVEMINSRRGVTIILTTHDLTDIERLSHRMMIIDKGKLIYEGSAAALKAQVAGDRVLVVDLADGEAQAEVSLPVGEVERCDGGRLRIKFDRNKATASEMISMVSERYAIHDLTVEEPEIESVIRRIYEEGLDETALEQPSAVPSLPEP
jgi:ABC-2 type transport system ATP-binding protein